MPLINEEVAEFPIPYPDPFYLSLILTTQLELPFLCAMVFYFILINDEVFFNLLLMVFLQFKY